MEMMGVMVLMQLVYFQAGGGGGQGGSGAGIIRILATYILYGDNAILDVRGGKWWRWWSWWYISPSMPI